MARHTSPPSAWRAALASELRGYALVAASLVAGWVGLGLLLQRPQNIAGGTLLLILATGCAAFGFSSIAEEDKAERADGNARSAMLNRAAVGCLLAGLASSAAAFALFDERPPRAALLLGMWAAGIALFLVAARLRDGARGGRAWTAWTRSDWLVAGALAALTAVAFAARATNLDTLPLNMHGDEGDMGMLARAIANGEPRNPFATGWLAFPNLWFFMQSMSLQVFGDTEVGLRMISAVVGALGIPATYVLGRATFNRGVGLIAAALIAVYHFHIQFSRLAVNNIGDPVLMALALAGFVHGLRKNSLLGFAVAGVALGALQHFYVSGRIAPIVLAIMLVHQLVVNPRRLWAARAGLLAMLIGFIVGIGPLALHYARQPGDLTNRINTVSIFGSGYVADLQARGVPLQTILLEQLRLGLGAYVFEPDHGSWYTPGMPLLDRLSAVLLFAGLGASLRRWRAADATMWPSWLVGVALAGGALTTNAPEVQRYIASAPATCVLIAVAIWGIADMASLASQRAAGPVRAATIGVLAGVLVVFNAGFYFGDYAPKSYRVGMGSAEETTALGKYLGQFGAETYAYYLGGFRDGPVRFLAPQVQGVEVRGTIQAQTRLPEASPAATQLVFVVLPPRAGELAALQARFPSAAIDSVRAPSDNRVLFTVVRTPR